MPRKRKKMNDIGSAALRRRLSDFVKEVWGNWPRFGEALEIPETTWKGWQRRGGSLPGLDHLITFATRTSLNLNWLVAGEGEMLRTKEVSTPEGELVALL